MNELHVKLEDKIAWLIVTPLTEEMRKWMQKRYGAAHKENGAYEFGTEGRAEVIKRLITEEVITKGPQP